MVAPRASLEHDLCKSRSSLSVAVTSVLFPASFFLLLIPQVFLMSLLCLHLSLITDLVFDLSALLKTHWFYWFISSALRSDCSR